MSVLFDLSPKLSPATPVWPGDQPLSVTPALVLGRSDSEVVNLSTLTLTPHLGAHADAPLHTEAAGVGIDRMELERYVGPCVVIDATGPASQVTPDVVDGIDLGATPRVLFKTGAAVERDFPDEVKSIHPETANRLAKAGVVLVGTDEPSVDPIESKNLPVHHALLGRGLAVLEGLALEPVPPGRYELIALPLHLVGVDASPVRAILRALPQPTV